MNELKRMSELRIAQVALRKNLKDNEEKSKYIRARITPIWKDKSKDTEVTALSKELVETRMSVRATHCALRELKLALRMNNKLYDRKQRKAIANAKS